MEILSNSAHLIFYLKHEVCFNSLVYSYIHVYDMVQSLLGLQKIIINKSCAEFQEHRQFTEKLSFYKKCQENKFVPNRLRRSARLACLYSRHTKLPTLIFTLN